MTTAVSQKRHEEGSLVERAKHRQKQRRELRTKQLERELGPRDRFVQVSYNSLRKHSTSHDRSFGSQCLARAFCV
eukprot:659920-Pleurochrysis_carterae.AAC.3